MSYAKQTISPDAFIKPLKLCLHEVKGSSGQGLCTEFFLDEFNKAVCRIYSEV